MTCKVMGCEREAKHAGMCFAHYRRKLRGRPLNTPLKLRKINAWELLHEAAIRYANAEDDREYELAYYALRRAALKYAHAPTYDGKGEARCEGGHGACETPCWGSGR